MERISASVGRKGINRRQDVVTVQTLLNKNRHRLKSFHPLEVDGLCGPKTIGAIVQFQSQIVKYKHPDGRVDPGGLTLKKLNEGAMEPIQLYEIFNWAFNAIVELFAEPLCFPLAERPTKSYKEYPCSFGCSRDGGRRKHAGVDLYAPIGTPIYAMDDGEVIRGPYHFYRGTHAIEIKHTRFIARYGEIAPKTANGLRRGNKVKKGQLIAYIGDLQNTELSMLHLELYKNTNDHGRLTRPRWPYYRRSDLMDPTPILDRAQCKQRKPYSPASR